MSVLLDAKRLRIPFLFYAERDIFTGDAEGIAGPISRQRLDNVDCEGPE